ncbi:SDR family oxidoreductase [Niabella insulamsoli]|uniref:SDR family oxidoreductase n=1 Tax=Niabella insulamsoli TaxID=3144874 RepID=UPI0031FD0B9E
MKKQTKKQIRPKQTQQRPGKQSKLAPVAETRPKQYKAEGKLAGKAALITGGDSGIGKAVALLFAKEGADICIAYLSEQKDANDTKAEVEAFGRSCYLIKGDLGKEAHCKKVIDKAAKQFGKIDIVVNNAGLHWEADAIEDITTEQLMKTFHSDFFSYFWITKYAMQYLKKGSSIINTASVTAYRGSPKLIDYSATKGAIISFTRALAANLTPKGIRVNAVAPGPIWTPLISSSFDKKKVSEFGSDAPMKRAGMPNEVAPAFLFLACGDSSYISGQVIHPNGGEIING